METSQERAHAARQDPEPGAMAAQASAEVDLVGVREPAKQDVATLHGDTPPDAEQLRDALAAGLGIPTSGLGALQPGDAEVALRRLGILAARVRHLEERVSTDELTGVNRRGAGLELVRHELERARRLGGALVVAFIDVDGLKQVNDREGHAAGDALLSGVGAVLRGRLRSYDVVLRYGGDEFVCALSGVAEAAAEGILDEVSAQVAAVTGGGTLSRGLATLRPDDTVATLVARADADLYRRRRGHRPA